MSIATPEGKREPVRMTIRISETPESEAMGSTCLSPDVSLTGNEVVSIFRGNVEKKKEIDELNVRIIERTRVRNSLEATYNMMLANQQDHEARYNEAYSKMVEKDCTDFEERVSFLEIDSNMYKNLLQREKESRMSIVKSLERIKKELKAADELESQAEECDDNANPADESLQDIVEDTLEIKRKLSEGEKTNGEILAQIKESRQRLSERFRHEEHLLTKEHRLRASLKRFTEKNIALSDTKRRLTKYYNEISKLYRRVRETLTVKSDGEVVAKREGQDIALQTEQNECKERIELLSRKIGVLHKLNEELDSVRANERNGKRKMISKTRAFDKGEYNPGVLSNTYFNSQNELRLIGSGLDEKIMLVRKVMSGIKHLLFKLKDNDKKGENGTWYDLAAISVIDEGDLFMSGVRSKISMLLLLLEQKITWFYTIVLQKVKHIELHPADDEYDDDENIVATFFHEHTILECRDILNNYVKKSTRTGATKERLRKKTTFLMSPEEPKGISGAEIPRIVRDTSIKEESKVAKEEPRRYVPLEARQTARLYDIDMLSIKPETIFPPKSKRDRNRELPQPDPEELKKSAEDNLKVVNKFNSTRTKQILNSKRRYPTHSVASPIKGKKRVTEVSLNIEREFANKPQEIIDIATDTFDALEKLKRSLREHKQLKKEFGSVKRLIPNFVNVMLQMRKSKKDDRIEKIAHRCHFLPTERPFSQPSTPLKTTRRDTNDSLMMSNMKCRLQNLKSTARLAKLPEVVTSFDVVYFTGKPNPSPRKPKRERVAEKVKSANVSPKIVKKPAENVRKGWMSPMSVKHSMEKPFSSVMLPRFSCCAVIQGLQGAFASPSKLVSALFKHRKSSKP